MKKAAIYDPYLDTVGGGERYMMTVAECLKKQDWGVDIFWDDSSIKNKIEARLGISLKGINFVHNTLKDFILKKYQIMQSYDLVFYLSDGSIPFLFGKKNILHFQVPFHDVGGRKLSNLMKLRIIDKIVCNSRFTKKFIDGEYGVKSIVLYPPVDTDQFKPLEKQNIIVYIGRFTDLLHNKRQDILVEVFKSICDKEKNLRGWKLILAGGAKEGKEFVERLEKMSKNYPIEIRPDASLEEVTSFYGKAKIFWSAAGYGFNEDKEPEKMEHFGISTAEAMSAGCVPVVIARGGQREIVDSSVNGFLWEKENELVKVTLKLMSDSFLWGKLSSAARKKSLNYSYPIFCKKLVELVE